jgi:hypothetical protein
LFEQNQAFKHVKNYGELKMRLQAKPGQIELLNGQFNFTKPPDNYKLNVPEKALSSVSEESLQ